MKRLLVALLLLSMIVFSSCSGSEQPQKQDYVECIVGEWQLEYTIGASVIKEKFVFRDNYTGEYSNEYSWDVPEKPQQYEFTWSYDENADVYLVYGTERAPLSVRITNDDGTWVMTCGPSTGTKVK